MMVGVGGGCVHVLFIPLVQASAAPAPQNISNEAIGPMSQILWHNGKLESKSDCSLQLISRVQCSRFSGTMESAQAKLQ